MILFVVYHLPDGIMGFVRQTLIRVAPDPIAQHAVITATGDASKVWVAAQPQVTPGAALLDVRKVLMQFGGLKALNDVDLAVAPGAIHGLIGPNGSGKSTMMNVLTGIYIPTAGEVRFEGQPLSGLKSPEIADRGIARTFQNVQLFSELTCIENVMVGLHHTYQSRFIEVALGTGRAKREESEARTRAMSILQFVGLEIGRALALDPKLLLLDEPSMGLAPKLVEEVFATIARLKAAKATMLLVEQFAAAALEVADFGYVIENGRIAGSGPAESLKNDPAVRAAYLGAAHQHQV